MQLLLDGEKPVLVTRTKAHRGDATAVEFHSPNENGTTTVTMVIHLGAELTPGDFHAIGVAVMAVLG